MCHARWLLGIVLLVTVALSLGIAAPDAGAQLSLPLAVFSEGGHDLHTPETYHYDYSDGNGTQLVLDSVATGGSAPMLDVQGDATNASASVQGVGNNNYFIQYWFGVVGPTPPPGHLIPVIAHVRGDASVSGSGAVAFASAEFVAGQYSQTMATASATSQGPTSDAFDTYYTISAAPNVDYQAIRLRAGGTVGVDPGLSGSFQAVADPVLEIDPSYPDKNLYTLVYSTNLPEPVGAALSAIVALSALGVGRRCRSDFIR
jgi:hypothetical protein